MMKRFKKFLGITLAAVTIFYTTAISVYATSTINSLNSQIVSLKSEVSTLKSDVNKKNKVIKEKEDTIIEKDKIIEEKEKIVKEQDSKIKNLTYVQSDVHFNPRNVTEVSGANFVTMEKMLDGTNMESYASVFVKAERAFNVNAVFLAAIVAEESGWGTSRRAIEDNNLAGLGVPSSTSRGMSFDSEYESIFYLAKLLSESYLDEEGKYFNGKSIEAVNVKYCVGNQWSTNVRGTASVMLEKL